ncbi:hypothetical protein METBIDRAFT_30843 [Metschnikowia bicuspidata var. bicuspidata NRRL YB-4993]|uniref:Large ribosomal subunit protein bL32m n=1 Tax=Metschnikowia bicuspidata var. bicuspidata NRRL YB-4993 TaxID=869754 RepID=A0A1A0HCW7_9ASCO|nr:hypothetical protein METBIDRAFT_30843 [Metschnikowia bicuspidata var. bicuspidata NRRL YB-4993]OBA21825.1 hypothetical protein METBIDRAFT_30843 [Metschnikowia bicuspidata var. bicuspidata NRRL YB-4993]
MSLALRLASSALYSPLAGVSISVALPRMPMLPRLADFLPKKWAETPVVSVDPRLEELARLLEKNSQPPFMIDNGAILKAAPKKKPSYKRTREKLYSPGDKQIQPLHNLRRCAACGRVKRSHFMCMHCFGEIRAMLKQKKKEIFGEPAKYEQELDSIDKKIIYPGKYYTQKEWRMEKKEWIPKREEPLMFDPSQVKKKK